MQRETTVVTKRCFFLCSKSPSYVLPFDQMFRKWIMCLPLKFQAEWLTCVWLSIVKTCIFAFSVTCNDGEQNPKNVRARYRMGADALVRLQVTCVRGAGCSDERRNAQRATRRKKYYSSDSTWLQTLKGRFSRNIGKSCLFRSGLWRAA